MPELRPSDRVLLVGRNSFLARSYLASLPKSDLGRLVVVGHGAIERSDLFEGIGCIVNFARHPLAASDGYDIDRMDVDLRLARRIAKREIAYVMLSSRKVYAPSGEPLSEAAATHPSDAYGRYKLAVEHALRDLLGDRLTVLRLANIFGYELIPGRRTFAAMLLDRLAREGRIHYDMSPFVERDFLPATSFARILAAILEAPPGGCLNVGSGIALPTGRLALWILEGFGRGELVIESIEERDAFVLDVGRLKTLYGDPCSYADLREACIGVGRRLASHLAHSSR